MKSGVALAAALLFTGCARPIYFTVSVPKPRALRLNDVYVYSFLELQEGAFDEKFLTRFRALLAAELNRHGVRNTQLQFRDVRSAAGAPVFTGSSVSVHLPVSDIIARNQLTEDVFGARYRLVIFPAEVGSAGLFRYIIRWHLADATTDEIVWSATAGHEANPQGVSEPAEDRARRLVEAFIEQLRSQGFIEALQDPARAVERPGPRR